MDRIGVAQVVHSLEIGGMERVVMHLASHLPRDRYRPSVFCITIEGDFAPILKQQDIEVISLGKRPGKDFRLPFHLAGMFRERGIQVVHPHNSGPFFSASLAAKIAGIRPVIYTDHSRDWPGKRSVIWTERVIWRLTDRIVSVSEFNKAKMIEHLHVPAGRIDVIPNGVAALAPVPKERKAALRREFHVHENVPLCLSVVRLEEQKGVGYLIDAAKILANQDIPCHFVVVGDGSLREPLQEKVRSLGMEDRFAFAGWRLDAHDFFWLADILVFASNWEGLPMTLLEGMSIGLPVVSTDVGDVGQAVADGESGFLVEPKSPSALAHALQRLIADPSLRENFGKRAIETFKARYSVEHMVAEYARLYERFL